MPAHNPAAGGKLQKMVGEGAGDDEAHSGTRDRESVLKCALAGVMTEVITPILRLQDKFGRRKRIYSKLWMSRAHCDKSLNVLNFADLRLQFG